MRLVDISCLHSLLILFPFTLSLPLLLVLPVSAAIGHPLPLESSSGFLPATDEAARFGTMLVPFDTDRYILV